MKAQVESVWRRLPVPVKDAAKTAWGGYARLTSGGRLLPDYLIVGTQRGGTTSMYKYLGQHPATARALTKELRFFDLNYERGVGWYRSRFPSVRYKEFIRRHRGVELVVGEASPDYLFYPAAPERVAKVLPNVRLIAMLRDPVERAWSHYWHQFKRGHETLSFADAIHREPERLAGERDRLLREPGYHSYEFHHHSYVARGIYVDQLQAWLERFPAKQLLIERSEDFFGDPASSFRRVQSFLGLAPWDLGNYETFNAFASGDMEPAIREELVERFRPHNRRLYELLGRDFGWPA